MTRGSPPRPERGTAVGGIEVALRLAGAHGAPPVARNRVGGRASRALALFLPRGAVQRFQREVKTLALGRRRHVRRSSSHCIGRHTASEAGVGYRSS